MLARLLKRVLWAQTAIALLIGGLLLWRSPLPPAVSCLLAVLVVPLLPALSMIRCFVRAWRHQGAQASPTPATHWWRAAAKEIAWAWRLYLWRQLTAQQIATEGIETAALPAPAMGGLAPASAMGGLAPVLLVHGFFCNHRVWDAMAAHLNSLGHPVRRLDLEPLFCSIDDYAPRIEAAVSAMLARSGSSTCIIVGHSMGGLATRAWLRACPARLADLQVAITLGTPHQGTQVDPGARYANSRQMRYHSDWLSDLAKSESSALRERFSACITRQDEIVFPQTEQWLPGMRVHLVDAIGHLELCAHPEVMAWLTRQISQASRTVPAPG